MTKQKPKPLHETLMDALSEVDHSPSREVRGRLLSLSRVTAGLVILDNHDAIADGFRARFRRIFCNDEEWPSWLFEHIAAEKARVAAARRALTKVLKKASKEVREMQRARQTG